MASVAAPASVTIMLPVVLLFLVILGTSGTGGLAAASPTTHRVEGHPGHDNMDLLDEILEGHQKRSISGLFSEYLIHQAPGRAELLGTAGGTARSSRHRRPQSRRHFALHTSLAQGLGKRNLMNLFSQRLGSTSTGGANRARGRVDLSAHTLETLLENMRRITAGETPPPPTPPATHSAENAKSRERPSGGYMPNYFLHTRLSSSLG